MKKKIFSVLAISLLTTSQIASAQLPGIAAATLALFGFHTVSSAPVDDAAAGASATTPYRKMPTKSATFRGDTGDVRGPAYAKKVSRESAQATGLSRRDAAARNSSAAVTGASFVCPPGEKLYSDNQCIAVSSICSQDCYDDCYDVCDYADSSGRCIDWTTYCYEDCGPVDCPCIEYQTQYYCAKPRSSCFSSRNWVRVRNRDGGITVKSMDQLAVGDLVEVTPNQFAKVLTFNHKQNKIAPKDATLARTETAFVTLHAGDARMELTADHLLYRNNTGTEEMVFAQDIQVGDRLVSKDGSELGSQVVTQIETGFKAVDFYAPITEGMGTIMIYSSADSKAIGLMASVFSGKDVKALTSLYATAKAKVEAATDAAGITARTDDTEYGNSPLQDTVSRFVQMITAN